MINEESTQKTSEPAEIPDVVYEGAKICNLRLRWAIKLFFAADRAQLLYNWVKQDVIPKGQFKDALDYLKFLDSRELYHEDRRKRGPVSCN